MTIEASVARQRDERENSWSMGDPLATSSRNLLAGGVFTAATLFALAYVMAGRPFLSEKFSYDDRKIQSIAQGRTSAYEDPSFQFVAEVYRLFGLADAPTLASVLGFVLFGAVMLCVATPSRIARAGVADWIIVLGSIGLAAIYLGSYSKDVFLLPVVAAFVFAFRTRWLAELVPIVAILLYAQYFRNYWFLIAAVYVMLRVIVHFARSLWIIAGVAVLTLAAMAVAFAAVLGGDLDQFREQVNEVRLLEDVGTRITGVTDAGGLVGGFVNSLVVLVSFILPGDLLLRGGITYVVVAGFLLVMWFTLFRRVNRAMRARTLTAQQARCFALIAAMTIVQSIFEPDYGSYIRHTTPLLVVVVSLILTIPRRGAPAQR